MATLQPLFVPSRATLLARLRLDDEGNPPREVVDQALEETRIWLFSSDYGLGRTLIASIQATPLVAEPSTDAEIARLSATVLETLVFKRALLQVLPVLFMDAGGTQELWNEEQFVRGGQSEQRRLLDQVNMQISDLLLELQDDGDEVGGLYSATIEVADGTDVPYPGSSIL